MNAPEPPRRLASRLRAQATGATASLVASTVLINVVRIGNTMCLTRLLSPDVFGLSGIIMSTFFVIAMISDVGFQAYIVRHARGDQAEFLDAVWSIHVSRGIALWLAASALAFPVAAALGKPALPWPLIVASLTFVIDGLASLTLFTALRTGAVRRLSLIDLVIFLIQVAFGLVAAFVLRNVWAIVASLLAASLLKTVASYVAFPWARRRFRYDRAVSTDLWRFSRMIAASSILTLFIAQIDKLVLARVLTLEQFGTYTVAATLAMAPLALVSNYTSRIIYPRVAQAWQTAPDQIRDVFYRCRGPIFYLYAFGGGAVVGGAGLIIRLLYDPRYLPAAGYLSILAVSTALAMITHSAQELLVATGRARATFEMNVVRIIWLSAGVVLAIAHFGAMAIVVGIGLIELPAYAYAAFAMRRQALLAPARELLALGAVLAGVGAGAVARVVGEALFPHL